MDKPLRFLTQHRFSRIALWARLMLAWLAQMLTLDVVPSRRRIRQRYRYADLNALARLVCDLAAVRAIEIAQLSRPACRRTPSFAPPGFRRACGRGRPSRRAVFGARLRKALRQRDPLARISILLSALADIDAFARTHLLARMKRRLTRLRPLVVAAPRASLLHDLGAPAPMGADSS